MRAALTRIPAFRPDGPDCWSWVEKSDAPNDGEPGLFPELEELELGTLDLDENSLLLSADSMELAARGRELIEPVLGRLLLEPEIEQWTAEDVADQAPSAWDGQITDVLPEGAQALFDKIYQRVLDEPILDGVSPREAAGSAEQRERAIAWIKQVENGHAHRFRADPSLQYDCGWLWSELGLTAFRNRLGRRVDERTCRRVRRVSHLEDSSGTSRRGDPSQL